MKLKQLSKRRKVAAILSAVLIIALAVTGTLAAFVFDGEIINEFGDIVTPGGTGHDDFDNKANKDVYFENYGAATLFVRIRLDEYMELGAGANAKSLVKGALRGTKTTWTTHIPSTSTDADVCEPGNLETPGVDFHDFWTWKMGSTYGERYYLPTLPTDPDAGTVKQGAFYNIGDKQNNPKLEPVPDATVITMAQWVAAGMPIGNYWVVDSDGWAYWAEPLAPKSVTGLLLNEVTLKEKLDQSYYYAINVRFYATDLEDIGKMRDTATDAGKELIDKLLGVQSLDDRLQKAIDDAEAALEEAAANPGKYTEESIDALEEALEQAIDARDNDGTDEEKEAAIDAIEENLPLTLTPATPGSALPVQTPGNTTLGFVPETNEEFPALDHGTHAKIFNGVKESTGHDRFCCIPLADILGTGVTAGSVSVKAVDTNLKDYIVKANDPVGGAPSIMFTWLPSTDTSVTASAKFAALNNATTAAAKIGVDGAWAVTTSVELSRVVDGVTQTAVVKVTFYYNHSLFYP